MRFGIRILALILSAVLLTGCARKEPAAPVATTQSEPVDTTVPEPTEPSVPQQMTQEETDWAMAQLEYAALAAAFNLQQQLRSVEGYVFSDYAAFIGDMDGDGSPEMVYGPQSMTFRMDGGRRIQYEFSQTGYFYYRDREGGFYRRSVMGDTFIHDESQEIWYEEHLAEWYDQYLNGSWERAFDCTGERSTKPNPAGGEDIVLSSDMTAYVRGEKMTEAAYKAHLEQIGMTRLLTPIQDYTAVSFDACYRDSLLATLDSYLSGQFSAYTGAIAADIDNDGREETLYLIPELYRLWHNAAPASTPEQYYGSAVAYMDEYLPSLDYTAVLVADSDGSELTVQAYCVPAWLAGASHVYYENNCLWLDGLACYAPQAFDTLDGLEESRRQQVYNGLDQFLELCGYDALVFREADIGDMDGSELLCFCRKDGVYYIIVICFVRGQPAVVSTIDLNNTGVYLTQQEGKTWLLTYNQRMTTFGNVHRTEYTYEVKRFGTDYWSYNHDFAWVSYSNESQDATKVAEFFDKLNVFLLKIIVLYDPYQLAGSQWMPQEQADWGTVPQQQTPQQDESVLGFVRINDPGSWLNLRQGPGTNYAQVLIDPADPTSFVRQAQGAPVSVLQTIQTNDPVNPVWVKVRITYADREFIGYSSKNYIYIPSEE